MRARKFTPREKGRNVKKGKERWRRARFLVEDVTISARSSLARKGRENGAPTGEERRAARQRSAAIFSNSKGRDASLIEREVHGVRRHRRADGLARFLRGGELKLTDSQVIAFRSSLRSACEETVLSPPATASRQSFIYLFIFVIRVSRVLSSRSKRD